MTSPRRNSSQFARRRFIGVTLVVGLVGLAGCDDGSDAGSIDAQAVKDAAPPADTAPPSDATPKTDVAPPNDAGPPPPDAAPPPPDAAPPPDATPPPSDAAPPPPDAVPPPDVGACTPEGASYPVVPDALPCCPGLTPVGCEAPGPDGACPPGCAGVSYCTRCGDGACGPAENPCNCPADCVDDGLCGRTLECLEHPAPIRCVGAWRCDPARAVEADAYGDDGCNYTCTFGLPACEPQGAPCPTPGDVCRPCPNACDSEFVCMDPDMALRCQAGTPDACEGLPHDLCVGAWACLDRLCAWVCD
jgi:hypothetical protein